MSNLPINSHIDVMKQEMRALVERYEANRDSYLKTGDAYNEMDARAEYIDPFFEILGWDLQNRAGKANLLREVIREVGENNKRPDYAFRLGTETKFFVEAKKPSAGLTGNTQRAMESAYQVRRYGWTKELFVSVLTNFEDLVIYDTTVQPSQNDSPENSRLKIFHYTDFVEKIGEIASLLSREAVYSGEFDEQFSAITENRPGEKISAFFLAQLNGWRLQISRDLYQVNPALDEKELNEITQKFILRILFLRMCEDKGIQTYEKLKEIARTNEWAYFADFLIECDVRFDSGLFDTSDDPLTTLADEFRLTPEVILGIIESLYYPNIPYDFSVLEPEFLGSVYEQFLVERIAVREDALELVKKPENFDRDIVSTPEAIIDKIVRDVFSPVLDTATSDQILSIKVLDPATGSGGFLISAFGYFIDALASAYSREGKTTAVYDNANGHQLVFAEKVRLLTSCFYGVDRDYLAVEVAKFSLLVKLLENETSESLPAGDEILPPLSDNLIFGDTLVDERIYEEQPDAAMVGIALDWNAPVPDRFDFIIGNPPYLKTEDMVNLEPAEYDFYRAHYKSSFKQFDKYYLFLEKSVRELLSPGGRLGMIVSRKFSHIESGKKIRDILSGSGYELRVVDFGNAQLFEGKTTYTCLLFLTPPAGEVGDSFFYEPVFSPKDWVVSFTEPANVMMLPRTLIGEKSWILPGSHDELRLIEAFQESTVPLGEIFDVFNGIQTSKNPAYVIPDWEDADEDNIRFQRDGREWLVEKEILKPFYDGKLGKLRSFFPLPPTARLIFPYLLEETDDGGTRAAAIPPDEFAREFPNALEWLSYNEAALKKRDIRPKDFPAGEWYRFGRDQALTSFDDREKIVVGINSKGDKYVYDDTDTFLASGGTAGECGIAHFRNPEERSAYNLYFILAILNHKAIEYFCRKRGSPFAGGWYSRGTAVLEEILVPVIDFETKDERLWNYRTITSTCRELCRMYPVAERASGSKKIAMKKKISRMRSGMDRRISELYGIGDIIDNIELPS
jgi:type I restriction-modification system DNA methylase subunit